MPDVLMREASARPRRIRRDRARAEDALRQPDRGESVVRRPASDAQLRLIRLADRAVTAARRHTPDGAGNMWPELRASHGVAEGRFARTAKPTWTPLETARAAAETGGAHCGSYSALSFAELVARGTPGPVIRGGMSDMDHAFTMIGDLREPGDPIVVDAWVMRPQGHLWSDSAWNDARNCGTFQPRDTWNGGRADPSHDLSGIEAAPMSVDEARAVLGVPEGRDLLEFLNSDDYCVNWLWTQPYATARDAFYRYTAR